MRVRKRAYYGPMLFQSQDYINANKDEAMQAMEKSLSGTDSLDFAIFQKYIGDWEKCYSQLHDF